MSKGVKQINFQLPDLINSNQMGLLPLREQLVDISDSTLNPMTNNLVGRADCEFPRYCEWLDYCIISNQYKQPDIASLRCIIAKA